MSDDKSILRFDCYRDAMTVLEYKTAVGERMAAAEAAKCGRDLKLDFDRRFVWIERR